MDEQTGSPTRPDIGSPPRPDITFEWTHEAQIQALQCKIIELEHAKHQLEDRNERLYVKVDELEAIEDEGKRVDRLVELNVQEQVMNLAKTSIVQSAWKHKKQPDIHGWVYGLDNGLIKPVFEMKAGTVINPIYTYDNL